MPQLIRTPEDIFREEKKDIYAIHFNQDDDDLMPSSDPPGRQEILQWLQENVPDSRIEKIAPSENSGFICGYFGTLRVDFSEADLQKFCARWETPDGTSIDPRFQCYLNPYVPWFERYAKFQPALARPDALGIAIWIDTPIGIMHHLIPLEDAKKEPLERHPGNKRNLWMHATALWPELQTLNVEKLLCGEIRAPEEIRERWCVIYQDDPFNPSMTEAKKAALIDWFRLPKDAVEVFSDDF